eukprot:10934988-Heterocapsa_arctica.AAC.1
MVEQPSTTFKQQPEDRSNTIKHIQHLKTTARRPFKHIQSLNTNLKSLVHLCVCAPVGRTE